MPWILQDRNSSQFFALTRDGEVDWSSRVDQATSFKTREEAVFTGLEFCDLAGFILREVVDKEGLNCVA